MSEKTLTAAEKIEMGIAIAAPIPYLAYRAGRALTEGAVEAVAEILSWNREPAAPAEETSKEKAAA